MIPVNLCPLCQSSRSAAFDTRNFHQRPVTNRICLQCGLVYQSPRMPDEELAAFYEEEYRILYQGSQGPNAKDLAIQRGRAAHLLNFIQGELPKVEKHLDIGCSAGLLLQAIQVQFHNQATGIEPGRAYREVAQGQGLQVFASLEELRKSGSGPFDLISLAHVLEHIPDPLGYLTDLRENFLAPGGALLLEVPNLYGHDCFEVAHLISYSAHSLAQVLAKAGWLVRRQAIHGQPRSEILPLYLTVLAAANPSTPDFRLQPESGVRIKRKFAMFKKSWLTRLAPAKAWRPIR